MNKFKLYFSVALVAMLLVVNSSCTKNDDDLNEVTLTLNATDIPYGENNVWTKVLDPTANLVSQNLWFSHSAMPEYGAWSGIVPSRNSDTNDYTEEGSFLQHQWTSMTGGGVAGKGTPYLVAFWSSFEDTATSKSASIKFGNANQDFSPKSLYVNNTTYAYYSMMNGLWCKVFGEGDYFILNIHGITKEGTEVEPISVYLVDNRSNDKSKWVTIKDWTFVSLESLGRVSTIYFTMESSDVDAYGMKNPAYFALDRLKIEL